jgi:uncharacterized repeat protein (TIGR01451 family)
MRQSPLTLLATLIFAAALLVVRAPAANAADTPPPDVKGLWLIADYPNIGARPGEEAHFNLSLVNYGLAPQLAALTLENVPQGWSAELRGGGRPVSAAFVDYNGKSHIELKVKVPADAKPQRYSFTVKATSAAAPAQELPLSVNVEPQSGAVLTAEPKLPTLRGTPHSSFDFRINVKNDSADNMLVTLAAQAPRGFQVVFKEGYGSQELTSLPFKAGESKELAVDVKPPATLAAGRYPIKVQLSSEHAKVETQLLMDVTGQPSVTLSGENDRLSGEANAGQEKRFTFILRNSGSAEARNITLSASPPSGWKVNFDPKEVPVLAPNAEEKVTATVIPSDKALAGDYMMSVRANGDAVSESVNYRVTVLTSTVWGVVGLGVIAASLLVLLGAVGRFGRR